MSGFSLPSWITNIVKGVAKLGGNITGGASQAQQAVDAFNAGNQSGPPVMYPAQPATPSWVLPAAIAVAAVVLLPAITGKRR